MEIQNNNNVQVTNQSPSRPTVPPKPKPSTNLKSTVGTQVNLRRKTSPSLRYEDIDHVKSNQNSVFLSTSKMNKNEMGQLNESESSASLRSSSHGLVKLSPTKPALPPKPVTGFLGSPKKTSLTPNKQPPLAQSTKSALQTHSSEPDARNFQYFVNSNANVKSKTTKFSDSPNTVSPKTPASANSKATVAFQFPPTCFLSPSKRVHCSKKSASLGRNFDLVAFTRELKQSNGSMSRVTPLDLSSCTFKPATALLPPSFGKAITFAPLIPTQPPPPPPRRKRSSASFPTSPTTPKPAPVYAKVDMEKKWEMRRLKELHNISSQDPGEKGDEDTVDKQTRESSSITSPNAQMKTDEDLVNNSWLSKNLPPMENEDLITVTTKQLTSKETESVNTLTDVEKTAGKAMSTSDKPLSENYSFLFHHIEQEKSQDVITDKNDIELRQNEISETGNCNEEISNIDENKHADEFERSLEQTLEILPPNNLSTIQENNENLELPVNSVIKGERETELQDPSEILKTVDLKIQNLQSFLSVINTTTTTEMEGPERQQEITNSEPNDEDLVSQIVNHKFDKTIPFSKSDDIPQSTEIEKSAEENSPVSVQLVHDSSVLGRKSWNCSESSSYSSETPSSSSSSLRDNHLFGVTTTAWIDEGEISTGALGDLDSDAPTPASHVSGAGNSSHPGAMSRRRRIASMFSSFGKGSSSSSSNGHRQARQTPKKGKPFSMEHNVKYQEGQKNMSDARIGHSQFTQNSSTFSTVPQKTQSLPGFGLTEEPLSIQSVESTSTTSSTIPSCSTLDSFSGSSSTTCERNEDVASLNSIDDELLQIQKEIRTERDKQAFLAAKELFTSERTFVYNLNLLTVDFPNALKQASIHPLISDSDLKYILGGLPELKHVNEILLKDFEERVLGWRTNPKIADILIKKGPFLKHYSSYIRNYSKIGQYFEELQRKSPKFDQTVNEFELANKSGLKISAFMLTPIQKMGLYAVTLEKYVRNLDENCEEYQDAVKALSIVRDVADHANEAIRLRENGDQMKQLQERLLHNNEIMKPDRQIVKEGTLDKVCRKGNQPRYFALMTDCLLCMMYHTTAGSNKDLKLRYELPLAGMKVHSAPGDDRPCEFTVISTSRSFNLVSKSEKDMEDWVRKIQQAIQNNIKKRTCSTPDMEKEFEMGKVAPVWIQDSRVTMCQSCTAEFTITFRRHHCRACGKVVCGNCSGNEAPLQYQNMEAARVCDDCYQYLLEEFDKKLNNSENPEQLDMEDIRIRFKKTTPNVSKRYRHKKSVPPRLEVSSNNAQLCGYLHWREKKSWKRRWFILQNKVLFVCMASEDVVAYKTIPILGYDVEVFTDKSYDGLEGQFLFKLTHSGQNPMIFQADSQVAFERWVAMLREATILT